jgi:hypothetical protein
MSEAVASERERREVLLGDLHVVSLMEKLPPTVFPVSASITMRRSTADDELYRDHSPPEYPVSARKPVGAYIPETTVYFDNPALIANERQKTWRFHEFREQFEAQLDAIPELGADVMDRIYLTDLRVVEIPPSYVSSNGGHRSADPKLYQDEGEMTIGRFSKHTALSASELREELGDDLPGDTNKPLRLQRIEEVTAKPYQGTGTASKRRYYTEGQADQYGAAEKTPKVWLADDMGNDLDEAYPLAPALQKLEKFFPALTETEFCRPVKFYGRTKTGTSFVANEMTEL